MYFDWDKKAYQEIPVAEQVEVAASLIGRARIATWTRDARLAARSCCRERVRSHCLAGAGGFRTLRKAKSKFQWFPFEIEAHSRCARA